jgi:hypothetical protein
MSRSASRRVERSLMPLAAHRWEDRMQTPREENPLGLGPRDRESSNTGSVEDTSYDARGSDPYTTGEPRKELDDLRDFEARTPRDAPGGPSESIPADEDTTSSEEP